MSQLVRGMLVLVAVLMLAWPGSAAAQARDLTIEAGEVVRGDVTTVSQPIVVIGAVEGDVTSFSGAIEVAGRVSGDVVSYSGTITIREGGVVGGNILSLAGPVERAGSAQVAGQLLDDVLGSDATAAVSALFDPASTGEADLSSAVAASALALVSLALGTLAAAIWPLRLRGVSRTLRVLPGRATLLGLLTIMLLGGALALLTTLLAISLVGLPLVPLLLLLAHVPCIYGLAALALSLAEGLRLRRGLPITVAAGLGLLVIVGLLMALFLFSPPLGLLFFYLLASAGLGAAILSRGGAFAPLSIG